MNATHLVQVSGAGLFRVTTNGEHQVDILRGNFADVLGTMAGDIQANLLHSLDCAFVHVSGWLDSGAENLGTDGSQVTQNALGHLRTAGIAGAEDEYALGL